MASLNKVQLIGDVGIPPEVRYVGGDGSGSQSKVATLRIATTERYRSRSGEPTERTEWHSVVAWRGLADIVEKYVKKGSQLYVEGRLTTRQWTDKTGAVRYTTEVQADNLFLLGRKSAGEDEGSSYGSPYQAPRQNSYQQAPSYQHSYQPVQPTIQQAPAYPQTPQVPAQPAPQQPQSYQQAPQEAPSVDSSATENDDLPF